MGISAVVIGITAAAAAVNVGMSIAGSHKAVQGAEIQADAGAQVARDQQAQSDIQQKQATLDAKRQQIQLVRNAQGARSTALVNATSQGAGQGTGLAGGFGQISGYEATGYSAIQQNWELGRDIYNINSDITNQRIKAAQAGGMIAQGQGLMSLGNSIGNAGAALGRLSAGFGGGVDYSKTPLTGGDAMMNARLFPGYGR